MFEGLLNLEAAVEGQDAPSAGFGYSQPAEIPVPDEKAATGLERASARDVLNSQASTLAWLEELGAYTGDPEASLPTLQESERAAVRNAFCSVTDPYQDPLKAKSALLALSAPPAVRHLAGMLSLYDWEYVKQAKEIRGFIVARLTEFARSPDPKTALPALKALGSVTEIGAFTERIEITRPPSEATPSALADRLREKLNSLRPRLSAGELAPVEEAVIVVNREGT